MLKKFMPVLLALMFVLSVFPLMNGVVSASPTVVYEDGYESGLGKWDGGNGSNILISTDEAHNGTHSLKMTSTGAIYYENHTVAISGYPIQGEVYFYVDSLDEGSRFMVYGLAYHSIGGISPSFFVYNDGDNLILQEGEWMAGWTYKDICSITDGVWNHLYFNASSASHFKVWVNDIPMGGDWYPTNFVTQYDTLICAMTNGAGEVFVDDWLLETGGIDPFGWPPTITSTPDTTASIGEEYYYNVTTNETSTVVVDDYPAWANVTVPAAIHGTPTISGRYYFNITVTSTSGTGTITQSWYVDTGPVTPWAPTITSGQPITLYAHINQTFYYNITTNESCTYFQQAGINAGFLNETTGQYIINLSYYWCTYWGVNKNGGAGPIQTWLQAISTNGTLAASVYFNITTTNQSWAPTIISSPSSAGKVGTEYYYNITTNETSIIEIIDAPDWANVSVPSAIHGIPVTYGVDNFHIHAWSVNGSLSVHQAWPVTVLNETTWAPTITSSPTTRILASTTNYSYLAAFNESSLVTLYAAPSWVTGTGYVQETGVPCLTFLLSGTPPGAGVYQFALMVTSENGSLSSMQYWNLTVLGAGWRPTITSVPSTTINANHTYYYNLTANESASISNYDVIGPAWANLSDPFSIDGTPTVQGYYNFSLKITSTLGLLSTYLNWTVRVMIESPWAPIFTSSPITRIITGNNWTYNITLNESCTMLYYAGPSWVFGTGYAQSGITPSKTFNISGIAASGVWQFALIATSVNGQLSTYQWFNLTVLAAGWAPTFTSSPSVSANNDSMYSWNLTFNETVSLIWTSSPSWLDVSDAFNVYGVPDALGYCWLNVSATSYNGLLTQNKSYQINVVSIVLWSPTITSTPGNVAYIGSTYYYNITTNESCTYQVWSGINALGTALNETSGQIAMNLSAYWCTYWGVVPGGPFLTSIIATSINGSGSTYQFWNMTIAGVLWAPSFNFTAITSCAPNYHYSVHVILNESGTIWLIAGPSWLTINFNATSNDYVSHYLNGTTPAGNHTYTVELGARSYGGLDYTYYYFNITVTVAGGGGGSILAPMPFITLISGMMALFSIPIAVVYWKYGDDSRKAAYWIIGFMIFILIFWGTL